MSAYVDLTIDGRPSGAETELQNGERIGTAGVERLEVGEPGVGLGLVNVVEAAEVLADECRHVQAGELLFVSGIVPVDEQRELVGGDDVVAQARQVFANMADVLAAAGCTFEDVVKVTIYLTDVDDRPAVNPVRQEVFGEARPASTLVEVSALVIPGARIEVECVALVPS